MTATTKEITKKLLTAMENAHRSGMNGLVRRRSVSLKSSREITTAYVEGAKHMLSHLVQMGFVEYVDEKTPPTQEGIDLTKDDD